MAAVSHRRYSTLRAPAVVIAGVGCSLSALYSVGRWSDENIGSPTPVRELIKAWWRRPILSDGLVRPEATIQPDIFRDFSEGV